MGRGNRGEAIFRDRGDYDKFLIYTATIKEEIPFKLHAYCLMPNHFHMLIQAIDRSISEVYHSLLSQYARYFNWRHKQTGHLFQRRYHALQVDTDAYFLGAMRYIHMNPVAAGLAQSPDQWKWNGFSEFSGHTDLRLLDPGLALSIFSDDAIRAERSYKAFMLEQLTPRRGRPSKRLVGS